MKRLLIIDDNEDIFKIISESLAEMFDAIFYAKNIDEAEELLTDHKFSLITLDINVQGRNGSEVIKFIMNNPANENQTTPIIIISGMMTREFIEKNRSRFAGILVKPFEMITLQKLASDALLGILPSQKTAPGNEFNELLNIKCNYPFSVAELDTQVTHVMNQVQKDPKLKKLFSSLKINRDPENETSTRIGMLINISVGISMRMEWNTEKSISKFVYAAYLHDMALLSRVDLARIHSLDDLRSKKKAISEAEFKVVFEHPNIAATILGENQSIPPDVVVIVRQHHELPDETGFPSKLSHKKIMPLSAIFIVAHDLTDYILSHEKWSVTDYLEIAYRKFQGPQFVKALNALESIA